MDIYLSKYYTVRYDIRTQDSIRTWDNDKENSRELEVLEYALPTLVESLERDPVVLLWKQLAYK